MTIVFVHGLPETSAIWDPLLRIVDGESIAVSLPGFGVPRPEGFTGTKDAYAEWLAGVLRRIEEPVDVVAHDIGALFTMRVASGTDVPLRSWAVDVANIFHPRFVWPEWVHMLQTPGTGEQMLKVVREAEADNPMSTASRLVGGGAPSTLALSIGNAHDEVMSRSILDFYRSAVPNVSAWWWEEIAGPTRSRGLVLLLPDPPEDEAMSIEVGERLGAEFARLDGLNHCWMAEAPEVVAPVLERFWASLD
jgi:pimeloyl-ACP methyl ester carboxylesterase